MTEPKKYLASLPFFPGFYYSDLNLLIENEMALAVDGGRTWEEVDQEANYPAASVAIAKGWVEAFSQASGLPMEWESLQSPKEYNFVTDRAFAYLPEETLTKLRSVKETEEFKAVLKKMFTSYDGFMSFYPNDPDEGAWLMPVEDWDHNQLQALIEAYIIKKVSKKAQRWADGLQEYCYVLEGAKHVWDNKEDQQPKKGQ